MTDPDGYVLRPAVDADAGEIADLVRTAYRDPDAGGWTTEAHLLADERVDVATVRAEIRRPEAVVLTLRDAARELISCSEIVRRDGGLAYFGMFAVRPALQSAGFGRRMLTAAEDLARERWAATRLEMTVIGQRCDLIAWYERRGYVRTGERRPFHYADLADGAALRDDLYFVVLAKDLNR